MGEQRNLTEENVDELQAQLEKMKETNPNLEYRFYEQGEGNPDVLRTAAVDFIIRTTGKEPDEHDIMAQIGKWIKET